ncbi:MAG: hypothetical protein OHK0056_33090 [Bacteriovoracaceae bacterium]
MASLQMPPAKTDYAENYFWVFGVVINKDFNMTAKEAVSK